MLRSMRISHKLLLSFFSLLILTMFVGFVGKSGMDNVSNNMDEVQSVNDILSLFNQARIHEKNFIHLPDEDKSSRLRDTLQQLQSRAKELQVELKGTAAADRVSESAQDAQSYLKAFDDYAQITVLRQQSMEAMKESSNDAFTAIKSLQNVLNEMFGAEIASRDELDDIEDYQYNVDYVMEQLGSTQTINLLFLNARKFEKEHIISADQASLDRARNSINHMLSQVNDLEDSFDEEERVAMAKQVRQQILNYNTNFERHASQMAQQQVLSQTMQQTADAAREACLAASAAIVENSRASVSRSDRTLLIITIISVIIGLFLALRIARDIAAPLSKTVEMLHALENGHLDTRLSLNRGDEIGDLGSTMDRFAENLQREVVKPLNDLASGNLNFDIRPHNDGDQLRTALKKLGDDMNDIMSEVQVAGEQIGSGSNQVSDASQALSQGATEQASSLEQISSSLHEISGQTRTNADSARDASKLTNQVQEDAEQGSRQMELLNGAMSDINQASQGISKIIKVIDEIAFQTNLLALNAAVEAARAGQHGKGFAVVAEEVRNLAARSAKAAHETTELIAGSVSKARAGADIAMKTSEALSKIVDGVSTATAFVSGIADASTEQAQRLAQVAQGVSQIDDLTQQNTTSAEQTAAAAEELRSQADCMQQLLHRFTLRRGNTSRQGALPATPAEPKPHQQPERFAPRPTPAPSSAGAQQVANDNWGGVQGSTIQITLNDEEFGKY